MRKSYPRARTSASTCTLDFLLRRPGPRYRILVCQLGQPLNHNCGQPSVSGLGCIAGILASQTLKGMADCNHITCGIKCDQCALDWPSTSIRLDFTISGKICCHRVHFFPIAVHCLCCIPKDVPQLDNEHWVQGRPLVTSIPRPLFPTEKEHERSSIFCHHQGFDYPSFCQRLLFSV